MKLSLFFHQKTKPATSLERSRFPINIAALEVSLCKKCSSWQQKMRRSDKDQAFLTWICLMGGVYRVKRDVMSRTVFNLRDVTSRPMFATDTCMMYYVARIEISEKQNNAEYAKQYRLKRKLLLQQQASTSSETEILQKQNKAEGNAAKTK
jgi:hypothetical protein